MTAPTRIGPLAQIALTVNDVASAITFYRDGLGLAQIPIPAPNLAFFECGDVRLMLSPPEGAFVPGGAILYFRVPDIQAAFAECQARGVTFMDIPHVIARMPDHELWLVLTKDPSGNVLGLMSEVREH
jgi:methylmalonyl-CoA/ethylmalonyl-CoA epimerase